MSDWIASAALLVALASAAFGFVQARAGRIQAAASVDALIKSAEALELERRRFRLETAPRIQIRSVDTNRHAAIVTLRFNGPQEALHDISFTLIQPTPWEIVDGAQVERMRIGREHVLSLARPKVGLRNAVDMWRKEAGPTWARALIWYNMPSMLLLDAVSVTSTAVGPSAPVEFMIEIKADTGDGHITAALPVPRRLS